jgi:hypothetical protein
MYCPKCGHQKALEELRFCPNCGFKLDIVKACLADADEAPAARLPGTSPLPSRPRHRDINIGVILMFLGALFASLMAGRLGPGVGGRQAGGLVLAAIFSSLLIFSRPIIRGIYGLLSWKEPLAGQISASRREMGFGATLMFLSTILSAIASLQMFGRMNTPPFFVGLLTAFALLLVISPYVIRALRYLVTEQAGADVASESISAVAAGNSGLALPAAREVPISVFDSPRVTTAEIVLPPSVTERTTNLL